MDYIFSYNVKYSDQFESINYINCFCESVRRIKFDGKLVIFTESEQRLKSKFNNLDVIFVPVQPITENFQRDKSYPLITGLEDLTILRVLITGKYIRENYIKNDDNILLIDSRDSLFQSNPFKNVSSPKLTFGEEFLPYINDWTLPQFEIYKFDQSLYSSILSQKRPAINAGVQIGSVRNFLKMVDDFTKELLYIKSNISHVNTKIPVCDQIIINKYLAINKPEFCEILPHQNNIIANYLLEGAFIYDGQKVYINENPVSIIHQYDRNPRMFESLSAQYSV